MDKEQRGNSFTLHSCFKNKRGQITLFIVIGLVILSLVIGVLVLREQTIIGELGIDETIEIPGEMQPVHNFLTDTIYDVSVAGFIAVGLQGGWVDIDDFSISGQTFFTNPDSTSSEVLDMGLLGQEEDIPYWYFMISPNSCISNCEFSTKGMPKLRSGAEDFSDRTLSDTSVEAQMDRFLEYRLKDDFELAFESLRGQGYDINGEGELTATTIIAEEDIVIRVDYKIVIDGPAGTGELNQYFVRVPLNLAEVFSLANEVIYFNTEFNFLEETFLKWMSFYQGTDASVDPLPPENDKNFMGMPSQPWIMSNVKSFIRDSLLTPFVQGIQVQDTQNYESNAVEGDEDDNLYRITKGIMAVDFEKKFLSRPYDLSLNFFYQPGWDIYLNVDPHDGELILPENVANNLLNMIPVSMQSYEFYYDVSAPILVTIKDDEALNGEGYNFQFAIETNIRSNRPISPGVSVNVAEAQQQTLFDDRRQWISGNVTIEVIDNFGDPVEDVLVEFSCGDISVTIGTTELNEEGKAILVSKFPVSCSEGFLKLTKVGYLGYGGLSFAPKRGEESYIIVSV